MLSVIRKGSSGVVHSGLVEPNACAVTTLANPRQTTHHANNKLLTLFIASIEPSSQPACLPMPPAMLPVQ
jgi:hypothetical protein